MVREKKPFYKRTSLILPLSLALVGLAAAVTVTILVLQRQEEEWDGEQDVENYDTKNVPIL